MINNSLIITEEDITDDMEVDVVDLVPYANYTLSVAASTEDGEGDLSDDLNVETEEEGKNDSTLKITRERSV